MSTLALHYGGLSPNSVGTTVNLGNNFGSLLTATYTHPEGRSAPLSTPAIKPGSMLGAAITLPLALMTFFSNMSAQVDASTIVHTVSGRIRGNVARSRGGREFFQFRGIPYAMPPVEELRFEAPIPAKPWPGILDASGYRSKCAQVDFFTGHVLGQEDCLYLNVFTPKLRGGGFTQRPLPVMIYIHGGFFMSGSSDTYRPDYFMDEDIVLVTFNYRVGALGFLNTGDGVIRGNMGMKDQLLVLKWVQDNIRIFGGDPNRVTIFGGSAGAASVHYHILSFASTGLFHKGISQSGTAIKEWSFVRHPAEQARRLATLVACPEQDFIQMAKCLKSLPMNKILQTHKEYRSVTLHPLAIYAPSVEGVTRADTFLLRDPWSILISGNFSHVPWISGVNAAEGLLYTARIIRNQNLISTITNNWPKVAPLLLAYDPTRTDITAKVTDFYFSGFNALDFLWGFQNFTDMFSDRLYNTATHIAALEHAKYAPVYLYHFSYPGEFSFFNVLSVTGNIPAVLDIGLTLTANWINRNFLRKPVHFYGVCHSDEVVMLFSLGLLSNIRPTHPDYKMSKNVVKLWVDFAYDGSALKFHGVNWPSVNPYQASPTYLQIDQYSKLIQEPFTGRVNFWKSIGLF